MEKKILIDAKYQEETRAVLLEDGIITEIAYEKQEKTLIKGNIYLAKITKIEPGLQAAFIYYEQGQSGFLPFYEIHPGYFNIPASDKPNSTFTLKEIELSDSSDQDVKDIKESEVASSSDSKDINSIADIEALNEHELEIKVDLETECDEEEDLKLEFKNLYKKYKIQEVLKKGQIILVQAQKEERGNKSPFFTTYISLAGKYSVLMPNTAGQNGVSRRIINNQERKRLKTIINEITEADNKENETKSSLIIRTAGIDKTSFEIKRDYEYLVKIWNQICNKAVKSTGPTAIHTEDDIIQRTIRDMFDHNVDEVLIEGEESYAKAIEFMNHVMPREVSKIKEYKNKYPIFAQFNIESQLSRLYQPIVTLPSGAYIVINPTEALTSIDVNSGKSINENNIEETAVKTNIEALNEIAKQLKLRDISGIIIVDFIDMQEQKHKKIVEYKLREVLCRDKAKIQISNISNLGLVEISRQRIKSPFLELHTSMCGYCDGKGIVRSESSNAMLIFHTIEQEIIGSKVQKVNVFGHKDSILHILNNRKDDIKLMEERYDTKLNFYISDNPSYEAFFIEKFKSVSKKEAERFESKEKASSNKNENKSENKGEKNDRSESKGENKNENKKQPRTKKRRIRKPSDKPSEEKLNDKPEKPENFEKREKIDSKLEGEKPGPKNEKAENIQPQEVL